jgi:hypothetical protein
VSGLRNDIKARERQRASDTTTTLYAHFLLSTTREKLQKQTLLALYDARAMLLLLLLLFLSFSLHSSCLAKTFATDMREQREPVKRGGFKGVRSLELTCIVWETYRIVGNAH